MYKVQPWQTIRELNKYAAFFYITRDLHEMFSFIMLGDLKRNSSSREVLYEINPQHFSILKTYVTSYRNTL